MIKLSKKILISLLLIMLMVFQTSYAFAENTDESADEYDEMYESTGALLQDMGETAVGSVNGEWKVIGLARAGSDLSEDFKADYLKTVEKYVKENMDEEQRLDANRSTEHSRIILALTSLGFNPTDVEGYDLTLALSDFDYVRRQGINGPIWALIALDSNMYPIKEIDEADKQTTRELLTEYILEHSCPDGGWALMGDEADVDMTAMAIQSLAPYYDKNEDVKIKVDKALEVLSERQKNNGAFESWGSLNSESTSQVIVALTAMGIDPAEDPMFVKDGCSALEGLALFYTEGGGFSHLLGGERDGMATEQGYYALTSYFRYTEGKSPLYDMTDVEGASGTETDFDRTAVYIAVFAIAAVIIAVIIGAVMVHRKKKDRKSEKYR